MQTLERCGPPGEHGKREWRLKIKRPGARVSPSSVLISGTLLVYSPPATKTFHPFTGISTHLPRPQPSPRVWSSVYLTPTTGCA